MVSTALEFKLMIDEAFSAYMDAVYGFSLQLKELGEQQAQLCKDKGVPVGDIRTIGEADNQELSYEVGGNKVYRGTVRDQKWRNSLDGRNWQWAAKMFIVTAYELWDSKYQKAISEELGLSGKAVRSDVMGEIRLYRNMIIHNGGVAGDEAKKLSLFPWVKPSDRVHFSTERITQVVEAIRFELEKL